MRENFEFPDFKISDLEKRKQELKETEEKKLPAQNNVLNMVKFEDCDFENTTIIMNFYAPD